MPLAKRSHPTSRASVAGAVLGIILIAVAVVAAVPVAMNWPASWPGVLLVILLGCAGVALIARLGQEPAGGSPQELARLTAAEAAKWVPIVKASGFTPER